MKILCVIDSLESGGAQRQLVGLAIAFKDLGHLVSFLVYHDERFFKKVLDEANIPVVVLIEPNYLKRLVKMRRHIRNGQFDSVLSFLEGANFICEFAGLPWRNWNLVVGERSANPNVFKSFKLKAYLWFHLFADFAVANSHESLKIVRKINHLLPDRKCKVIYNMVDLNMWKPAIDYTPCKEGKINLVVAASHQNLKNAKGLIEAINQLNDKDKLRIKVDWYGDDRADNSLYHSRKLVQKYFLNDIFTFHEATENICQKMQYADVVGLFSFYEGLPNAICEGMALGKPIIATKVSDLPSLVDDKLGGYLCDTPSVESIAAAIRRILLCSNEQLIAMGKYNREKAILLFEKTTIVNNYLKILQNA